MASVFPSVVILGQTELIASAAPLHLDKTEIVTRAAILRPHLPEIEARMALQTEPLRADDVPLLTDDFAPVDSLLRGIR